MLGMENKWFMTLCALLGQVHLSVMWLDKVFSIMKTFAYFLQSFQYIENFTAI